MQRYGLLIMSGIIFGSQLFLEVSGVIVRKPGFGWVLYASGLFFLMTIAHAAALAKKKHYRR